LLVSLYVLVVNSVDFISFDLVYRGGIIPLQRDNTVVEIAVYDVVSAIRKFRPNVAGNRFAMATFYRTSFDDTDPADVRGRHSLAIVSALEYQKGVEINPFQYQSRQFFSDFLIQNPMLMEIEGIYQSPEALLREGLKIAPCYPERYLGLAEFLNDTGRQDEAYALLVKGALPWSHMRYDNHDKFRFDLFREILRLAKIRNDRLVLERLLKVIESS